MKKDTFAIIIPTYNCPDPLREILESLKRQMVDYPQTEIIVVDDGGIDDLSWVREYPNVTLYRQKNGGAASARNNGMDLAQESGTEYIAFLDSDDEIYDNYLPTIYEDMRAGYAWVSYDWVCDGYKERAKQTSEPLMINCAMWAYAYRSDLIGDKRCPEHMILEEDQAFLHSVLRDDVPHKHSHTIFYNYIWARNENSVVHRYLRGELGKVREEKKNVRVFKNIFYISNVNSIGGVETMFYNMARKYAKTHDITIVYRTGDINQILRLKKFVRCIKWLDGMHIKCEKAFFNINHDIISYVEADEYYQIIHADYKAYKLSYVKTPDINKFIAVSKNSEKTFREISGEEDVQMSYNPIVVDKPKRMLRLISPTRMTWEKGMGRMRTFAELLESNGIPYTWEVFTSDRDRIENPNFVYREPTLDIITHIAAADYLVQLSDTEGYSYSILESLCVGTPVIITDFPSAYEMQVVNGVNGFILPMDMTNVPVAQIYKGLKKFKYTPHEDRWGEILAPGKSDYEEERNVEVKVKCKQYYYDIVLQKYQTPGEEQIVSVERADKLVELGVADYAE